MDYANSSAGQFSELAKVPPSSIPKPCYQPFFKSEVTVLDTAGALVPAEFAQDHHSSHLLYAPAQEDFHFSNTTPSSPSLWTADPFVLDSNSIAESWKSNSSSVYNCDKVSDKTNGSSNGVKSTNGNSTKKRKSGKSSYKHVPHHQKPVHLVAKRNARERKRVQAVNLAFVRLRKCVPVENRNKRLSKVKTLHRAIEYIDALQRLIEECDGKLVVGSGAPCSTASSLLDHSGEECGEPVQRSAPIVINQDGANDATRGTDTGYFVEHQPHHHQCHHQETHHHHHHHQQHQHQHLQHHHHHQDELMMMSSGALLSAQPTTKHHCIATNTTDKENYYLSSSSSHSSNKAIALN